MYSLKTLVFFNAEYRDCEEGARAFRPPFCPPVGEPGPGCAGRVILGEPDDVKESKPEPIEAACPLLPPKNLPIRTNYPNFQKSNALTL